MDFGLRGIDCADQRRKELSPALQQAHVIARNRARYCESVIDAVGLS